jgi:tyrosinase
MQDPKNRLNAIVTLGMQGMPGMPGMPDMPGMPATPATPWNSKQRRQNQDPSTAMIDLEWLAPPIKLMDAVDQLGGNGGAYCYVYV